MVPIGIFVLFIIFALFSAGRLMRPLILPIIVIMTLGYALKWAGMFGKTADDSNRHHSFSQPSHNP